MSKSEILSSKRNCHYFILHLTFNFYALFNPNSASEYFLQFESFRTFDSFIFCCVSLSHRVADISTELLCMAQLQDLLQDGPSLEKSSYFNVTLGYLGPWDPWTLELLDLFPPPLPPHTSSYLILSLPPTLLLWYCLVWFGMGGLSFSFDIGD